MGGGGGDSNCEQGVKEQKESQKGRGRTRGRLKKKLLYLVIGLRNRACFRTLELGGAAQGVGERERKRETDTERVRERKSESETHREGQGDTEKEAEGGTGTCRMFTKVKITQTVPCWVLSLVSAQRQLRTKWY